MDAIRKKMQSMKVKDWKTTTTSTTKTNKWSYSHQNSIEILPYSILSWNETHTKYPVLQFDIDALYAKNAEYEEDIRQSNAISDQFDIQIRDTGKKVQKFETNFEEILEKMTASVAKMDEAEKEFKDKDDDVNAAARQFQFQFNSQSQSIQFNFQALRSDGGWGHGVRGEACHHRHEARPHVQGGGQHHQGWSLLLSWINHKNDRRNSGGTLRHN